MLREDIFELIEYVDKERAIVNMYTPGTEMTPKAAKKLKEQIIQSTDKHLLY
jgi:MoaA/NifB/PqqE/SkfB family radical SAM enzyme